MSIDNACSQQALPVEQEGGFGRCCIHVGLIKDKGYGQVMAALLTKVSDQMMGIFLAREPGYSTFAPNHLQCTRGLKPWDGANPHNDISLQLRTHHAPLGPKVHDPALSSAILTTCVHVSLSCAQLLTYRHIHRHRKT